MNNCSICNNDKTNDKHKVHVTLCHTCYRIEERKRTLLKTDKFCKLCNINSSTKWYSGPTCRKCFRASVYDFEKHMNVDKYKANRLKNNLRSRISKIVSGTVKQGSAIVDLDCSIEEFKLYMESQFQFGMTWDNYGHKTWHIDHVRPLSSFDLLDPKQLKAACNYKNLQPLWAKDNLMKGGKWQK
jgi:hypothetical protein